MLLYFKGNNQNLAVYLKLEATSHYPIYDRNDNDLHKCVILTVLAGKVKLLRKIFRSGLNVTLRDKGLLVLISFWCRLIYLFKCSDGVWVQNGADLCFKH